MSLQTHESRQILGDWVVHQSKTYPGKKYYFNTKTKATTWNCPHEVEENKNVGNRQRKILKAIRPSTKLSSVKTSTANNNHGVKDIIGVDKIKQTKRGDVISNSTVGRKGNYIIPKKKKELPPITKGKIRKGSLKLSEIKNSQQCNVSEKQNDVLKINDKEIEKTHTNSSKAKPAQPSSQSSAIKHMPTYTSANERLLSLRQSLSKEVEIQLTNEIQLDNVSESISGCTDLEEPMEIDNIIYEIKQFRDDALSLSSNLPINNLPLLKDDINMSNGSVVIVADTNVFIGNLDIIEMITVSQLKDSGFTPILVVPWRVINELDFLKSPRDKQHKDKHHTLMFRAKCALDFLYKMLPTNPNVKGQSLKDANHHMFPCEVPDDEILNCCLQIANNSHTVILLSCDKNLCNKAVINDIKAVDAKEMENMLQRTGEHYAPDINKRNCPLLENELQLAKDAVLKLLSRVLEDEMKKKFDNMWELVVVKHPPWSLGDVLMCLDKHWMAVFSELFPRMQDIVKELSRMIHGTVKNYSPRFNWYVKKFKKLSLRLANKCILIPEYSDIATECVQVLKKEDSTPVDSNLNIQMKVVSALEKIWSFFSSFSAILANNANIPHTLSITYEFNGNMKIQDRLQDVLSQLNLFVTNVESVLNQCGNTSNQHVMVQNLCLVINDTLKGIGAELIKIEVEELAIFCLGNRALLEDVPTKFIHLHNLLLECDTRFKTVC